MKPRTIFAAVVLLLSMSACAEADTSTYNWVDQPRSDADLQAAAQVCDQRFGSVMNGWETSEPYKACMLAQGWQYDHTRHEYPDPDDPGMMCHDITIFGVKGSSCSNYD